MVLAGARSVVTPPVDDDWTQRSTAVGVILADRLDSSVSIDDWKCADATSQAQISFDATLGPPGANGSAKWSVLNVDGASSGQMSVPFGELFGDGETVWFSYRVYLQADETYQVWPTTSDGGSKWSILSRDCNGAAPTGSNQTNEVVIQTNYNGGQISGYRQAGFASFEVAASTACTTTDFKTQPSVDNGANPLSGTNPDTGSAWSSCEQARAQFGLLYGARSNPGAENYRQGLGDPFSGGFPTHPGEWLTVTGRVIVGTDGVADSQITVWAAREDQPYVLLWDISSIQLGDGSAPDFNALNLLPYVTNRTSGGCSITSRTNNITGATIHVCGLGTPTGDGTLEYNATTQRFRWQGVGGSFGSARGFSAANDILWLNVIESGTNFVVVEVDPDSLPSSGTVTDTVTIDGDNRPDTFRNYSDVIISTQAINAPGGDTPL